MLVSTVVSLTNPLPVGVLPPVLVASGKRSPIYQIAGGLSAIGEVRSQRIPAKCDYYGIAPGKVD